MSRMTSSYTCSKISTISLDGTAFYHNISTRNMITTSYTCSTAI